MRAALGIDQLHVDQHLIAASSYAAFHDIANPQIAPDMFSIDSLALVGKGCVAGDHEAPRNPRQIGRQIIGNAVREILLVRVVRKVREGKDNDRQRRYAEVRNSEAWLRDSLLRSRR